MARECTARAPVTVPVWLEPVSIFGSLRLTMFIESLHVLAIPSTLAPLRLDAGRYTFSSRFGCRSDDRGYVVRRHYTGRYLPAPPRRVLLMGQQVLSAFLPPFSGIKTIAWATSCRKYICRLIVLRRFTWSGRRLARYATRPSPSAPRRTERAGFLALRSPVVHSECRGPGGRPVWIALWHP